MEVAEFTPRVKNSNNDRCLVKGCKSKGYKNLTVSFHLFPKPNERFVNKQNAFGNSEKIDRCKAWKIALKMNKFTRKTKVCSLHFKKSDYFFPDLQAKKRFLKMNAVPSCNLPGSKKINEKLQQARLERRMKRSKANSNSNDAVNETQEENMEQSQEQIISEENEVQISVVHGEENNENTVLQQNCTPESIIENFVKASNSPEPLFKHIGIQVNTNCSVASVTNCIKSDSQLNTATGIESFELLDTIVEIVKKVYHSKYENHNMIMNTKDRVIMAYMKLKQNLSYSFLALLFNYYTAEHCQRVFYDTIKILSKCLRAAIPWPSKEEISKNLPKCFEGFEDVRVVLDCTELFIQTPPNLCCQVLIYSDYKGSNTCKIMTGVSPAGNITFISKPYGGRATNSTIFQQSRLMQLLDTGDGVMVDREFLIDKVCKVNQLKCIRPPFLKEKKQFSKEESILTSKIATARVHIERSNQRIKTFQIVESVIPASLVPILEDIFIVICGTINMSTPILSDSEFMTAEK